MKHFAVFLLLGICLVSGQILPDPISESEAAGLDEEPSGDAAPPPKSEGVAGERSLGYGYGSGYGTCPAFSFYQAQRYCPGGKHCDVKGCSFTTTVGYYYGLPYQLYQPVTIYGILCRFPNQWCSNNPWRRCHCRTRWRQLHLWRVIVHNGYFYHVYVYFWRPVGCSCVRTYY